MASHYWIKLYTEILEDPKMGQLSDHLYRRVIEIFCIAGDNHKDGALPSPAAIAWKLRTTEQEIATDLQQIYEQTNIVHPNGNGWVVTKFAARQAPADPTAAQRMQAWRERNEMRNEDRNIPYDDRNNERNVTRNVTTMLRVDTDTDTDTDQKKKKKMQMQKNPPAASSSVLNSFNDISARDAEHVYTAITGQPSIPNDQIDSVVSFLIPIIASYTDPKKMHDDGLRHFVRWCNTRGKNGRLYSRTNTGWLAWWNESIAPSPGAPEQERIEYTGALCGKGQALKRKAEDMGDRDHEQHILDYRKHLDECRICGGKDAQYVPMPDNIRDKIKELRSKMEVKHETGS